MNPIPAIVLAGGKSSPEMIAATGVSNRALTIIDGEPMVTHIINALSGSEFVDNIVVVGDNIPVTDNILRHPDQGGLVDNIFAGMDVLNVVDRVLVSTSDIPFIRPEMITDFIEAGLKLNADLIYPIVPVGKCTDRFPGIHRTSVALREGRFTGGNMMLLNASFFRSKRDIITAAYAARKSPIRLASMMGMDIILRLLAAMTLFPSALSLNHLERTASRMLDGNAKSYISPWPEIATDIDKPEDIMALKTFQINPQ